MAKLGEKTFQLPKTQKPVDQQSLDEKTQALREKRLQRERVKKDRFRRATWLTFIIVPVHMILFSILWEILNVEETGNFRRALILSALPLGLVMEAWRRHFKITNSQSAGAVVIGLITSLILLFAINALN